MAMMVSLRCSLGSARAASEIGMMRNRTFPHSLIGNKQGILIAFS